MKRLMPLLALCLTVILVSCSSGSSEDSVVTTDEIKKSYAHSEFEYAVMDLLNEYRTSQGLPAFDIIEHISYVASEHNDYMISTHNLDHNGFEQRHENLVNVLGAFQVSENVACGFTEPSDVVEAWLNSPSHKKNIDGSYTHFGLSVKCDSEGYNYFTNIFIKK